MNERFERHWSVDLQDGVLGVLASVLGWPELVARQCGCGEARSRVAVTRRTTTMAACPCTDLQRQQQTTPDSNFFVPAAGAVACGGVASADNDEAKSQGLDDVTIRIPLMGVLSGTESVIITGLCGLRPRDERT